MQVTQIELKVGVRLNVGDYQGVNAEVTIRADLDPREGEGGAFDHLRRSAVQQLAATCLDAHPNQIRESMGNGVEIAPRDKGHPALTDNTKAPAEEAPKRTRRSKEQIAADQAKADGEARRKAAEEQLGDDGGLGEDGDGLGGEDDLGALLGDEIPETGPEVTLPQIKEVLTKLGKTKGTPSVAKILNDYKVSNYKELKPEQYREVFAAAQKLLK